MNLNHFKIFDIITTEIRYTPLKHLDRNENTKRPIRDINPRN